MSLILDALRKSEAERRRGQAPSIYSATPAPSTRRQPPWSTLLPIAGGVLLLLAAAVFWLRDDAPVTKEELVEHADAPSLVPAVPDAGGVPAALPPPAATPPPLPATPAPATAAGTAPPPAGVDALVKPAPPVAVPKVASTIAAAPVAPADAPAPADAASAAAPDEALPPMAVLDPTQRAGLPPLKLSMHVYDVDPARRFAIIDGQRVTEGAQIGNAIVLEIRRDGVVLDVSGRHVLLPRP